MEPDEEMTDKSLIEENIRRAQKKHECQFGHVIKKHQTYLEMKEIVVLDFEDTEFNTIRMCLVCAVVPPICQGGCGDVISQERRFCKSCAPIIYAGICENCGWKGRASELSAGRGSQWMEDRDSYCPECNCCSVYIFEAEAK